MQIATRGAGARFCPVASAFQDDDVTPMVDGGQPVVWASSKLREYDRDPQFAWRARNLYPANFLLKETDCKWKTPSQRPSYRRRSSGLRSWSCSSISSSSFRSPKSSGCSTTTWTGRGWDRRCSCSGLYGARVLACMVGVVAVHVGPQRCRHDTYSLALVERLMELGKNVEPRHAPLVAPRLGSRGSLPDAICIQEARGVFRPLCQRSWPMIAAYSDTTINPNRK